MARTFNNDSLKLLKLVSQQPGSGSKELFKSFSGFRDYKSLYNSLYRLVRQEFLERRDNNKGMCFWITEEGAKLINRFCPEKDGIWKLVIFDIPERQKYVRVVLRAKLKSLHFKKWQNSIWVSPFALDAEIEEELNELAKKFFVRLIKTTEINNTDDLEKLFKG